ncbi:PadR family transcriptional regulator [Rhodococcus sp. 06-1477-1B]|uniref:PadR family transcriptional regulator n=1 Tax=Rhodococcus sp. 06-1474-1B TaxID=2022499 RepID=UPI000B9AF481|nr:PadR family transcriptional regulator [Rhodococcus sp. 06-1474-1B]OZD36330.1 PadR family transcriptional regulator [Rhodococcus sp. 06-1477-1B]OZD55238.1 PadR family transcriptional regulator [Rhodococcus sp. 06-1474-1B]
MSLPHAILGLLAIEARSGYDLTEALSTDGIGKHAWTAGHTSIYPELSRLAAVGHIEVIERGARGRRTYAITDTGRDELTTWLVDTPIRPAAVRNENVLRLFLLSALGPEDAIVVLTRIIDHAEAEAAELRRVREPHRDSIPDGPSGFGQLAAEYGIRTDDALADWAHWAIAHFRRIMNGGK